MGLSWHRHRSGEGRSHTLSPAHTKSLESARVPGSGDSKAGQGEERAPNPFHQAPCPDNRGPSARTASVSSISVPLPPCIVLAMESALSLGIGEVMSCEGRGDLTGLEEGEGQCHRTRGLVPLVWS